MVSEFIWHLLRGRPEAPARKAPYSITKASKRTKHSNRLGDDGATAIAASL